MQNQGTMCVKEIVRKKAELYELCLSLCLEAATKIALAFEQEDQPTESIERKELILERVKVCPSHATVSVCAYDICDSVEEIGYICTLKNADNVYVCMYLRYDTEDPSGRPQCIRCETTDSDISISWDNENKDFVAMEVEFPHYTTKTYKEDEYAIWVMNRTDPWQEQFICDYVIGMPYRDPFDAFYRDYVSEFGEEVGDFKAPEQPEIVIRGVLIMPSGDLSAVDCSADNVFGSVKKALGNPSVVDVAMKDKEDEMFEFWYDDTGDQMHTSLRNRVMERLLGDGSVCFGAGLLLQRQKDTDTMDGEDYCDILRNWDGNKLLMDHLATLV